MPGTELIHRHGAVVPWIIVEIYERAVRQSFFKPIAAVEMDLICRTLPHVAEVVVDNAGLHLLHGRDIDEEIDWQPAQILVVLGLQKYQGVCPQNRL